MLLGRTLSRKAEAEAAGVSVDVALTPSCLETPVNLCST